MTVSSAATAVVDKAIDRLQAADNPLAKLHILRDAAQQLKTLGALAEHDIVDRLSNYATDVHELKADEVQSVFRQGEELYCREQAIRLNGKSSKAAPGAQEPKPFPLPEALLPVVCAGPRESALRRLLKEINFLSAHQRSNTEAAPPFQPYPRCASPGECLGLRP